MVKLVDISAEYDEANDKIISDYKTLISNLNQKIQLTMINNDNILKEEEKLKDTKILEEQDKEKLEQKVKDSDKLIEKNVEIKQSKSRKLLHFCGIFSGWIVSGKNCELITLILLFLLFYNTSQFNFF